MKEGKEDDSVSSVVPHSTKYLQMGIAPSTKKSLICGREKNNRCPKAVITVTSIYAHERTA